MNFSRDTLYENSAEVTPWPMDFDT